MRFTPHDYQKTAIDFTVDHPNCLLALSMGLGKTAITMSALKHLLYDEFSVNRVLIVAPKYVASDTWPREQKKWDDFSGMSMAVAVGTASERIRAVESDADVVCINRENLIWLIDHFKEQNRPWPFDCIVIDESSSFKSYSSKRFKALRLLLRKAKVTRLIELTGTPRPRSIEDLWSQIYLLDRGQRLETSMTGFRNRYMIPGRRNGVQIYEWLPRDGAEDAIYRKISDISMSMTADDWLSVPDEQIVDHFIELEPKVRKQYRELEKELVLEVDPSTIVGQNAGVLTGKLCQMANGAVYDDEQNTVIIHGQKLECLQEILESTEEPVMVFYWFRHDYDRLMEYFAKEKPRTISGQKDIEDWNAGRIRLLLAHPASMGHGLNLQDGGHIIVWFSLTWSLEIYQQANARLHRQGQKNNVQIHRIIAGRTVDEDITRALDRKQIGQNELIEAIKARARNGI